MLSKETHNKSFWIAAKLDAPLFSSSLLFEFFNECNQSSNLSGKQAMNWVKSYATVVESDLEGGEPPALENCCTLVLLLQLPVTH